MRVLSKVSHDDHDLGTEYELDGELLDRLLVAGVVVPAAEWTYEYRAPQNSEGDQKHIFTQIAPAPAVPQQDAVTTERAPAPVASAPEALETRAEG